MKKTILLVCLASIFSFAQNSVPTEPEDKSPQKSKHERTEFYEKDGKTFCGVISQYDTARWHVFLGPRMNGITVPRFDTRDEAVKWVKAYCPVQGKVATK